MKGRPRIYGIMLVRDEDDIIEEVLRHAATFCEHIWVGDTGSTDATWEIVSALDGEYDNISAEFHQPLVFHQGIRSIIFDKYRHLFADGDWICKLDADEIYAVDPRRFIADHVRWHESAIYLQWYYFRLTDRDVEAWERGDETVADRARSVVDRRRYYQMSVWSELRMFRYRRTMQWGPYCALPWNVGYPARARVPILHYPHRDPLQMAKRFALRREMRRRTRERGIQTGPGPHWDVDGWREEVVPVNSGVGSGVAYDARGLARHIDEDKGTKVMKGLTERPNHWPAGKSLPPAPALTNHRPVGAKGLALRVLHPALVRLADRTRPRYPEDWAYPTLDEATQSALATQTAGFPIVG